MSLQPWVPSELAAYLAEPSFVERTAESDKAMAQRIHDMWTRLATRPEMQNVWAFIAAQEHQLPLTANGGLIGTVNRGLRQFEENPKLSAKSYEAELLEISKLAGTLARKMKKFCDAGAVYNNPFPLDSLLNDAQLKRASVMVRSEVMTGPHGDMSHSALNYYLPPFDQQLEGLATRAATEAKTQVHRFKGPRKLNDRNVFRTYFIRLIADYFLWAHADFSPTRISTFCNVALDDADIGADDVRKACHLSQELKHLLSTQRPK